MSDDRIERAARAIERAWRDDDHLETLPGGWAPTDVDEGYAVQARFAELCDTPQVGWKIAATSIGGQQHIGVDRPLIGRLFADRVYASPATLLIRGNNMRVAEAEFCFRFGREVAPGDRELDENAVMDHVDALFPAIEVPDSRFRDFVSAGGASLAADNACAREFVLGDEVAGQWRDIAFDRFAVSLSVNGVPAIKGTGADVLGDPRRALAWLVNEARRLGLPLKAGDLVTTGVVGKPVAINAGDRLAADFGVLGAVELVLSDGPGEPD